MCTKFAPFLQRYTTHKKRGAHTRGTAGCSVPGVFTCRQRHLVGSPCNQTFTFRALFSHLGTSPNYTVHFRPALRNYLQNLCNIDSSRRPRPDECGRLANPDRVPMSVYVIPVHCKFDDVAHILSRRFKSRLELGLGLRNAIARLFAVEFGSVVYSRVNSPHGDRRRRPDLGTVVARFRWGSRRAGG